MPYLLGRHVACCSRGGSCAGERILQTFRRIRFGSSSARGFGFLQHHFTADQLGQSEVQYFYSARLAQEDIGRFDVAVNDSLVMRGLQAIANLSLVNSRSNPRIAGVLTVMRIIAGTRNHSGDGRGVATSPSSTQCHAPRTQSLSGSSSTASWGDIGSPTRAPSHPRSRCCCLHRSGKEHIAWR